jgi:hypothetical protein
MIRTSSDWEYTRQMVLGMASVRQFSRYGLTPLLQATQKLRNRNPEGLRQSHQRIQAGIPLGSFKKTNSGAMQATPIRKFLLRPVLPFPQFPNSVTQSQ